MELHFTAILNGVKNILFMINHQKAKEVFELGGRKCFHCGCKHGFSVISEVTGRKRWEIHHGYQKGEYNKSDRDEVWNLFILCADEIKDCHKFGKDAIHNGNTLLNKRIKEEADRRKPPEERDTEIHQDLIKERKRRKKFYHTRMESFKKMHGGLTPSQIEYRRQKKWREQNKK